MTLKTHEETARKNVRERTAFDIDCDDDIELVRIGDIAEINANISRMVFGVTCGGKRAASYVVTCTNNLGSVSCSPELNSVR